MTKKAHQIRESSITHRYPSRISIIVAMDNNRVIGVNNKLPWHLSEDLKHFKALTMGHPVIMGRKTYESIGKPLPDRTNIIVTHKPTFKAAGCVVVNSPQSALEVCHDEDEVFVIGGAELYREMLSMVQRVYVTEIHAKYPGDTWFPKLDSKHWTELSREKHTDKSGLNYDFVVLDRITN